MTSLVINQLNASRLRVAESVSSLGPPSGNVKLTALMIPYINTLMAALVERFNIDSAALKYISAVVLSSYYILQTTNVGFFILYIKLNRAKIIKKKNKVSDFR